MDLVGVDTGFEVAKSFYEQSFGEPRWRPSPITARYVAAGLHGRKSGRGFYDYGGEAPRGGSKAAPHRPEDPDPPEARRPEHGEGVVVISGAGVLADELRAAATEAGYEVRTTSAPSGDVLPALIIDCDCAVEAPAQRTPASAHGARLMLCASGSLGALDPAGSAVGFHVLPPLASAGLVELTRNEGSSPGAAARAERFFGALGKHVAWVGDGPGLVLGRIVCQLINESAFALGEGVGSARDIDTGMVLGLSHPRGPFQWAEAIGLEHVLAVLQALCEEYREERYRPAPALRRLAQAGRMGGAERSPLGGAGLFDHPG
jgi:3-hydroxybutyryl-CoA dehydrogenase